ncbi:hypothetical protein MAPG_04908 [Magnaporthiopsis poae ATCC 64411]|uniref:Uncharacterized protein n=1 Tax=Magnaporthiopsis poae (strain ATCC 64411 / 73-15) TaxID=644358 RepID=A0A0C4DY00_MAGP6|nr:hypothetical protein MAPG_04908 [Magnaporthiopsis poae ATCC 64411]
MQRRSRLDRHGIFIARLFGPFFKGLFVLTDQIHKGLTSDLAETQLLFSSTVDIAGVSSTSAARRCGHGSSEQWRAAWTASRGLARPGARRFGKCTVWGRERSWDGPFPAAKGILGSWRWSATACPRRQSRHQLLTPCRRDPCPCPLGSRRRRWGHCCQASWECRELVASHWPGMYQGWGRGWGVGVCHRGRHCLRRYIRG